MTTLRAYRYITTDQLILRPIELADAHAVFQYTSDPRVAHFTQWDAHSAIDQTLQYIQNIHQLSSTHVWGITLPDSHTLIGECSITLHEDGRAELSYALAGNYWGNGYMTHALTTILRITDVCPEIVHLEAWIIQENRASCRVAEKAGLMKEQIIPEAWYLNQRLYDIALYSK